MIAMSLQTNKHDKIQGEFNAVNETHFYACILSRTVK